MFESMRETAKRTEKTIDATKNLMKAAAIIKGRVKVFVLNNGNTEMLKKARNEASYLLEDVTELQELTMRAADQIDEALAALEGLSL